MQLTRKTYQELLRLARRHAYARHDADDLLHDALIAAIADGREPGAVNRAWLNGVMRNINAMNLRTRGRRQRRETTVATLPPAPPEPRADPRTLMGGLPPSLAIVALLAFTGHTRAEIRHLLRISDDALRQRISSLRKTLSGRASAAGGEWNCGREPMLAFGAIRRSLLPFVRKADILLASHDPDGHLFAIKIPRPAHKQASGGNRSSERNP
ncbi:RNA polymerase sigma factor [Nitratireductor pacificus]|uniref:RNA polymerase sigma factor n=1 Tax=Nitratireductor pacificus TaxID=1231180 RepID=UPI000318FC74|nr:sigma-70 family RNA polymerase sigma factor [Nitratireductor pacificus]